MDEGRLGFLRAALSAFAFLLQRGFREVHRDVALVRFERSDVFVNVYHGRLSYQVGLELGRTCDRSWYSLHEILTALAPEDAPLARSQTTNRAVLERCLREIAISVERHCDRLLAGDEAAFAALRARIEPQREIATLQAQFGATMDRADRAWERKALAEARDLYERAEPALDELRRRRLRYLRSRQ